MRLEVSLRPFDRGRNQTHFLLRGATLVAELALRDGTAARAQSTRVAPAGPFVLDIQPAAFASPVDRLDLRFEAVVTLDGQAFTTLRVGQRLLVVDVPGGDPAAPTRGLVPGGWRNALDRLRVSNAATHPLLDVSQLPAGRIILNALVVDLTDGWMHLHRSNTFYQRYADLSQPAPPTFKVLAFLGGEPLIWHAIVPSHLQGADRVSPHVFLSPADRAEKQNVADPEKYLTHNTEHFRADGGTLFNYLAPPVEDTRVADLRQKWRDAATLRNTVGIEKVANPEGLKIVPLTTRHWRIGAGFQKAFAHRGDRRPAQLLLMPQRSGSQGFAATGELGRITDAIVDVLQTNTLLLSGAADVLIEKDKLVLSCYSESGHDVWPTARAVASRLKAVVAIEPQNVNALENDYRPKDEVTGERVGPPSPLGKEVIPQLLDRRVAVFIIGRHHAPKYRPQVAKIEAVRLVPAAPAKIFAYPPDPASSDFVKYRVHRIFDRASDPLLVPGERQILDDLAAKNITGAAALRTIFTNELNRDFSPEAGPDGIDRWYSHHFALSGGEHLALDPGGIYGTPVTYSTFFADAIAEIG